MNAPTLTTVLIRVVAFFAILVSFSQIAASLLLLRGIPLMAGGWDVPFPMMMFLGGPTTILLSGFLLLFFSRKIGHYLTLDLQ